MRSQGAVQNTPEQADSFELELKKGDMVVLYVSLRSALHSLQYVEYAKEWFLGLHRQMASATMCTQSK